MPAPARSATSGANANAKEQRVQDSPEPAQDRDARRSQFGWAIYDWANSAYSTAFATAFLPLLWAGFFAPAAKLP